ncbi:MAG: WXG100 family type VII secretion target [Mycobacterium sp.]
MSGDEDGWTRGNRERDEIYARQRLHGSNIDGGTESASIPTEDFGGWAHARIKEASDAYDSESALEVAGEWEQLGTGFKSILDSFKSSLNTAINGSWTGEGAAAAKQGISDYKSHAEQVSDSLSLMATKPAEVETAMTQIKGLMPEVVQVHEPLVRTPAAYEQHYAEQALAQQKQDEARMIMRSVWSPVSQQAGSGIPALPSAPQFGDGAAAVTAASSHDWGGGKDIKPEKINPIDEGAVRAAAAAALADPTQAASPGGGAAGAAGAAAAAAGAAGGGSGAGAGSPASAAAAAAGAARGTTPTSGGSTGPTGPNTGSVPGTYGIGRWGKPTTNKDENKDKDKSDLTPLAAGPIIAGSYTAGAGMGLAATPSPMQGMGIAQPTTMMTPGAAGAQHHQEDEDQHFTPEFLVSIDNGNELVGPLPKVSPAVIGVWNEEHVAYQNPHPSPWDPKPYDEEE